MHLENLRDDPRQVFFRIASFLGIDKEPFDNITYNIFNEGGSTVVSSKPILSKVVKGLKRTPRLAGMAGILGMEVNKPELTDDQIEFIWDQLDEEMLKLDQFLGYSTGYTRSEGIGRNVDQDT